MVSPHDDPPIVELLVALTGACPDWMIWKRVEAAVGNEGDVDSVAPRSQWDPAAETFRRWARSAALGPTIACRHLPGALFLVACDRSTGRLVELDLYSHLVLRGRAYLEPAELEKLVTLEPPGFRRLRPGAEGLFLLLATGLPFRSVATPPRIRELLASDPAGVELASTLFGRSARAAVSCAETAIRAERPGLAAARWELAALARVGRRPRLAFARIRFGLRRGMRCPVLSALAGGRRIPADADRWLDAVRRTHAVE